MRAKHAFRTSAAVGTSAYKIMELVGRFRAPGQWGDACALRCYRASEELRSDLSAERYNSLDELYSRLTLPRGRDEDLHEVMVFWGRLDEYRERMLQSSENRAQAAAMLHAFKYYELWYELTCNSDTAKSGEARSIQCSTSEQDGRMQLKPL